MRRSLLASPTYVCAMAQPASTAMIAEGMDFDAVCASGPIKEAKNAFGPGVAKDSKELILGACGEPFDVHYYTKYLTDKYSPHL